MDRRERTITDGASGLPALYAEAAACVRLLRDCGRADDAEAIDRGLYGATSGEALSLIGAAAKAALSRRDGIPSATRDRLAALLRSVDAALRAAR